MLSNKLRASLYVQVLKFLMLRRHVEIRIPLEIRRFNATAGCSSLPGTLGKLVMVHDLLKREEQRDYDEFMGAHDEQYVPTCST